MVLCSIWCGVVSKVPKHFCFERGYELENCSYRSRIRILSSTMYRTPILQLVPSLEICLPHFIISWTLVTTIMPLVTTSWPPPLPCSLLFLVSLRMLRLRCRRSTDGYRPRAAASYADVKHHKKCDLRSRSLIFFSTGKIKDHQQKLSYIVLFNICASEAARSLVEAPWCRAVLT